MTGIAKNVTSFRHFLEFKKYLLTDLALKPVFELCVL